MNFYKTLGLKNSRIDVADALRGLAVAGIILYHSVEHFNMCVWKYVSWSSARHLPGECLQ